MKKRIAKYGIMIAALGAGLQLTAHAQDMEFGVKAGALYNMPSYGNQLVSNAASKFGLQAGVFVRNAQKLYVQTGVAFSTFKSAYLLEQKNHEPTFYQLNIPIQVGYRIVESDRLSLRASLGPQINYNLKKNDATGTASFKSFTADGVANIGIDIKQFTIDLSYNHSISKTSKDLDSRNRIIGLSVGYRF